MWRGIWCVWDIRDEGSCLGCTGLTFGMQEVDLADDSLADNWRAPLPEHHCQKNWKILLQDPNRKGPKLQLCKMYRVVVLRRQSINQVLRFENGMIKRIVTHDLWWLYWTQLWSSTSILPTLVRRRTYCVPCLQTNMAIWIWLAMVLEASRTGLNPAQNGVARVWGVLWCQNQFSRSSKLCSTAASNYWLDNSLRAGTHRLLS